MLCAQVLLFSVVVVLRSTSLSKQVARTGIVGPLVCTKLYCLLGHAANRPQCAAYETHVYSSCNVKLGLVLCVCSFFGPIWGP